MQYIKSINIENYTIVDKEFAVGVGANRHHVFIHDIDRYNAEVDEADRVRDESGKDITPNVYVDEVNADRYCVIVIVHRGDGRIGIAKSREVSYDASYYHDAFVGAYKAACSQVGIEPCLEHE